MNQYEYEYDLNKTIYNKFRVYKNHSKSTSFTVLVFFPLGPLTLLRAISPNYSLLELIVVSFCINDVYYI